MGQITILLQISYWMCRWKNYENRLIFSKDMDKSIVCGFLGHPGCSVWSKWCFRRVSIWQRSQDYCEMASERVYCVLVSCTTVFTPCLAAAPVSNARRTITWDARGAVATYLCPPGWYFAEGGTSRTSVCVNGIWPHATPMCTGMKK